MHKRSSDARAHDDPAADSAPAGDSESAAGIHGLRAIAGKGAAALHAPAPAGELERITQRIARLERQNRWLKLSIVVVFLVGGLYTAQKVLPPDIIVRQTLMESKEIKLLDNDGVPRLFLRMYSRVPVLQLLDDRGKPRMSLGLRFDDTPFFDLSDKTGTTRAMIELNELGEPLIELFDASGKSTTRIR